MACCWNDDDIYPLEKIESFADSSGSVLTYDDAMFDGTPEWWPSEFNVGLYEYLRSFRPYLHADRLGPTGQVYRSAGAAVDYEENVGGYIRVIVRALPRAYFEWVATLPDDLVRPPLADEWSMLLGIDQSAPAEEFMKADIPCDLYNEWLADQGISQPPMIHREHWKWVDYFGFGGDLRLIFSVYHDKVKHTKGSIGLRYPAEKYWTNDKRPVFIFYDVLETWQQLSSDPLGRTQRASDVTDLNGEAGRRLPIGHRVTEELTVLKYLECVDRRFPGKPALQTEEIKSELVQDASPPTMLATGNKSRASAPFFKVQTNEANVQERFGDPCIPIVLSAPAANIWHGQISQEDTIDIPESDNGVTEYVDYAQRPGYIRRFPTTEQTVTILNRHYYTNIEQVSAVNMSGFPDRTPIGGFYSDEQEFAVWETIESIDPNPRYYAYGFPTRKTYWGFRAQDMFDSNDNIAGETLGVASSVSVSVLDPQHPKDWPSNAVRFGYVTKFWTQWSLTQLPSLHILLGHCLVSVNYSFTQRRIAFSGWSSFSPSDLPRLFRLHGGAERLISPIGDMFGRPVPYNDFAT